MKSLAKNSLYNAIYKFSTVFFSLITAAYVSRALLVDGVGKVNSAQNIVQYFVILAALGLPTYGTKVIAAVSDKEKELSKTFEELFAINAFSTLLCTIAYYGMIFMFPYFRDRIILFAVSGLLIPLNVINVDWFYQGIEEFRYIMMRSIAVKIIAFMLTFIIVRNVNDCVSYAALLVFANAANYVFNIVNLRKYIHIKVSGLCLKQHFKPIFVLLAASIAIEIYTLADTTMLAIMSGDNAVGLYSNAMRIIRIVKNIVVAVAAVYLPRLSYYFSNNKMDDFRNLIKKGINILLFISVPCAIGIILVSHDFVPLFFGNPFAEASVTTSILALSTITVSISNFIGYQVLVTINKEKIMFYSTIMGAVMNIILNFFLIKLYSYNGAAIASVVTEFCITVFQFFFMKKYVDVRLDRSFILSIFISTFAMIVSVTLWNHVIKFTILRLIGAICIGALSYGLCLIATKNEIALTVFQLLKKRVNR